MDNLAYAKRTERQLQQAAAGEAARAGIAVAHQPAPCSVLSSSADEPADGLHYASRTERQLQGIATGAAVQGGVGAVHQPAPRSTSTSDEAAVLLELPGDSLMVKVPPAQEQQPEPLSEPVAPIQQSQVEPEHLVRQQEAEQVSPVQRQKVEEPTTAVRPAKGEGSTQAAGADGNRFGGGLPVPAQIAPDLQCSMQNCTQGCTVLRLGLLIWCCVLYTTLCCP